MASLAELIAAALRAKERPRPPSTVPRQPLQIPQTVLADPIEERVTAPLPPMNAPYPENLVEILLGSREKPPTGTWTPEDTPRSPVPYFDTSPDRGNKYGSPAVDVAWELLGREFPHIARSVNRLDASDDLGPAAGITGWTDNPDENAIEVNPEWFSPAGASWGLSAAGTLGHEMAHVGQRRAFPEWGDAAYNWVKQDDYFERTGEQQARALERALAAWLKQKKLLGGR